MKKTVFLLLALALALALVAVFQPMAPRTEKAVPRTIAIVQLTEVDDATVAGFRDGMAARGYREGVDVVYANPGAVGSPDKLEEAIRKLLQKNPDLFLVSSTPATLAVKRLTEARRWPPVVFAPVNDPLGAGVVENLSHPGGHITGVRLPTGDDLRMKWLLRIAPGVKRVYLPYSADDKSALVSLEKARQAAEMFGVTLLPRALAQEDIATAAAAIPREADAVFLPRDSRIEARIEAFVAQAEKRRLPLSAPSLAQVRAGALFSYGYVHQDTGGQAARLADQIFKGTAPGDLPVEMAENQLAINLAAAGRIGIAVPDEILHQAEYLIRQ